MGVVKLFSSVLRAIAFIWLQGSGRQNRTRTCISRIVYHFA